METPTRTLHRLTSYGPGREWDQPVDDPRVVQDLETNDLDRLPWFFKRYETTLSRIPLPRRLPRTSPSAISVLSGSAEVARCELDLAHLSRLLHLSAGVVRTVERPYGEFPFRAAGSAGGRFPLELYVVIPDGTDLPPGVHWYDAQHHALAQIGPTPRGEAPTVIVTGVPWRTGWRYRERGYRHIYWDAGTMLAQMLAVTDSAGIATRLHTLFPDPEAAELVGADGVHEFPVALIALADAAPTLRSGGKTVTGEVDSAPLEFPLVTSAQRAGERSVIGAPWDRGQSAVVQVSESASVEDVVLSRGSQRRMDPTRGLSNDVLMTSMTAAMRGISLPHFIAVHDVDGITTGIYRWPDLHSPIRTGDLRDELYRLCLSQGLARDAAFVVIAATDVGALDDREYRDAHLAAGLVEGRLHLAAYALGASASGMTFIDSMIPELVGAELHGLLFTCVGVPEYRSAPGGPPGTPTRVRTVTPRLDDD